MNENILYLLHTTDNNIDKSKYLKKSNYDDNDRFPGVYFTLITKDNLKYEELFDFFKKIIRATKLPYKFYRL